LPSTTPGGGSGPLSEEHPRTSTKIQIPVGSALFAGVVLPGVRGPLEQTSRVVGHLDPLRRPAAQALTADDCDLSLRRPGRAVDEPHWRARSWGSLHHQPLPSPGRHDDPDRHRNRMPAPPALGTPRRRTSCVGSPGDQDHEELQRWSPALGCPKQPQASRLRPRMTLPLNTVASTRRCFFPARLNGAEALSRGRARV
jgi:hypothetical protein